MPLEAYRERVDQFCAELKAVAPAPGFSEVMLPGRAGVAHRRAPRPGRVSAPRRPGRAAPASGRGSEGAVSSSLSYPEPKLRPESRRRPRDFNRRGYRPNPRSHRNQQQFGLKPVDARPPISEVARDESS